MLRERQANPSQPSLMRCAAPLRQGWWAGRAKVRENGPMMKTDAPLTRLRDLPGPRGLPVLGNLHRIRFDRLHLILEDWADSYGAMYALRIGPQRVVVLADRSAIERVLRERPERFRRTAMLESVAAEMRLKGVFAAEGEDWRRQRRMVVAALSRAKLKDFFPTLAVSVSRLRATLGGGGGKGGARRPVPGSDALHGRRHDAARVRCRRQHP